MLIMDVRTHGTYIDRPQRLTSIVLTNLTLESQNRKLMLIIPMCVITIPMYVSTNFFLTMYYITSGKTSKEVRTHLRIRFSTFPY